IVRESTARASRSTCIPGLPYPPIIALPNNRPSASLNDPLSTIRCPLLRICMLEFKTSKGVFTVQLFEKEAPISVENFLRYADEGFFDATIFHRVIAGFMIQGGGLTADLKNKRTHPPIENEATNGLKNKRGTLAMARTNDVNSATSQFFINLVDNDFLDHRPGNFGYA